MIVLVIVIAFIGSAILSILTLHPGAEWMVRCLGKENCLETEAVNGCSYDR